MKKMTTIKDGVGQPKQTVQMIAMYSGSPYVHHNRRNRNKEMLRIAFSLSYGNSYSKHSQQTRSKLTIQQSILTILINPL